MSDSSAQPAQKMVSRFVGNSNSTIGSLMKRGMTGGQIQSQVSNNSDNQIPPSTDLNNDLSELDNLVNNSKKVHDESRIDGLQDLANSFNDLSSDHLGSNQFAADDQPVVNKEQEDLSKDQKPDLDLLEEVISEVENEMATNHQPVDIEQAQIKPAEALPAEELLTPAPELAENLPAQVPPIEPAELPATSTDDQPTDDQQTGLLSQVVPQVITDNTDTLNPQHPVGSAGSKESAESVSLDQVAIDAARGAQQVELEPSPEIPPEVESYLQKVEDHAATAPKEIVIADGSNTQPNDHNYPSQPVVVLPITPEIEKEGGHKNPKFSIRWLVEWSKKIMKVFSGKVIYRFSEEDQQ